MEAIILAGGFGTRLIPFTYTRAKSLLPILNKPMISYLIESLPDNVDKIILAVNYKKSQIEEYFKENNNGKEIIVNDESQPLGTGGAVKFAERYLTGDFLVLNSDIICSLNIIEMINFHKKNKAVTTISLWPVENVSEFGVADVQKNGNIIGFVEKPKQEDAPSNYINAGAYFCRSEILDYIDTGRLVSMEKEIFPKIIEETRKFYGFIFDGYWMDIGRIISYIDVHRFFLDMKKIDNYIGKNCEINGDILNCCLGNNVYIGANSKLESVVVYDGARIEKNSFIKNCVIGEKCIIDHNSQIKNSVVGDNETIIDQTILENKMIWTQPIPKGYPKKQVGNVIDGD